jgi:hypothetical protein
VPGSKLWQTSAECATPTGLKGPLIAQASSVEQVQHGVEARPINAHPTALSLCKGESLGA